MARIDSFLRLVTEQHASDLHFSAGSVPTIRYAGDLLQLPFRELAEAETRRFLLEILTEEQKAEFNTGQELDFVYTIDGVGRFRTNYYNHIDGLGAVFRIIPQEIPSLEELYLPDVLHDFVQLHNGLVLITGPTGAGKTTTLASIISRINTTDRRHIITIEDPIEFIHEPAKSVIAQRQVGRHAESFASALRSALRESPDVIVVGEMRDLETIHLALQAAETGVLVFGTLHTDSAPKAVDRIIDAVPEGSRDQVRGLLSVLLRAVVSQVLVKRANGEGRIAAFEVLIQNWAVANMIRESKVHQLDQVLLSAEHQQAGMVHMDTCLFRYVREGIVEPEVALRLAKYPDEFRKQISAIREELT